MISPLKIFIFVIFITICFTSFAESNKDTLKNNVTISGFIEDFSTGEKLIGANVYDNKNFSGVSCNNYGFYSLTLNSGIYEISYSYIGFQTQRININLQKDTVINIKLKASIELKEVEIVDSRNDLNILNSKLGSIQIPINSVKNLPSLTGEIDIMKIIQLLPGIKSGNEASSGIYVRGGGPDQNLILLDGVPVYNANHLFGYLSVFNSNAIQNIEVIKGGFPARFGGRLSSVIDIQSKDGNNKKISGNIVFSYVCPQITLEGPILSDKTSFLFSARRTFLDLFMNKFPTSNTQSQGNVNSNKNYYFYDINAKINHRLNTKNRLYLSIYNGIDKYNSEKDETDSKDNYTFHTISKSEMKWGNTTTSLRWNHLFGNKLFMNLTSTYTSYHYKTLDETSNETMQNQLITDYKHFKTEYNSGIEDIGCRIDFDYMPKNNHQLKAGIHLTHHLFNPGIKMLTGSLISVDTTLKVGGNEINCFETDYFLEDEIKITPKLRINAGLHSSQFFVENKNYFSLQPRFSLNYRLKEDISLKLSYSEMIQYMHLLSNTTFGLPMDLWVPATSRITPQKSWQLAAGIAKTVKNNIELSLEMYYKKMTGLIEYKEGSSIFDEFTNWEDKVAIEGKGESYGIELLLQKKTGKTTGWIGYTISWSNRQFDELNLGKTFPYRYDKRHDISIVINHKLKKSIELSGVWTLSTGGAMTIPIAFIVNNFNGNVSAGNMVTIYGDKNSYRMPVYHRLDLGVNFIKEKKHCTRIWNFSIYNMYARKNPFFVYYKTYTNPPGFSQLSILMFVPSVSYQIKF